MRKSKRSVRSDSATPNSGNARSRVSECGASEVTEACRNTLRASLASGAGAREVFGGGGASKAGGGVKTL